MNRLVIAILALLGALGSAHAGGLTKDSYTTARAAAQAEGLRRLDANAAARKFEGRIGNSSATTQWVSKSRYQISGLTLGVGDAPEYATNVRVAKTKSGLWKAYTGNKVFNLNANP